MHEYFEFLKKDAYFSFIAIIVVAIISLIVFILFGGKTNENDVVSGEKSISWNINYND